MKRFVFRLARLEQLREVRRREARAQLAGTIAEAQRTRRRVDAERDALHGAMATELPEQTASDAGSLKQLAAWRESRRDDLRAARHDLDEAEEAVRRSHAKHTEEARAHRVLERLRERRHRRWLSEVELEERKFLDEAHLLRLARKRRDKEEG